MKTAEQRVFRYTFVVIGVTQHTLYHPGHL